MTAIPASPWSRRVVAVTAALCAIGLGLLIGAFAGAQGERALQKQIPWLNLAVGGSVVAASGQVGLLLVGRQRVAQLRRRALAGLPVLDDAVPLDTADGRRVTVEEATWYHRPSCLLVRGKPARTLTSTTGFEPCAVCSP